MADKKITQLPASTVPLAGTEVLPIVQGTTPTTKQVSVANLTAGRSVSQSVSTSTSTAANNFVADTSGTPNAYPTFKWLAANRYWWGSAIDNGSDATLEFGRGATPGTTPALRLNPTLDVIVPAGNLGIGTSSPSARLTACYGAAPNIKTQYSLRAGSIDYAMFGVSEESSSNTVFISNVYAGNNNIAFQTYGSGSLTERMRISSAGDVTVSTGNLVIGTSGKGIDFSATASGSGTMTSELLADYEEGTWTPAVSGVSLSTPLGTYTKIGNKVFANFTFGSTGAVSASNFLLSGLPYTPNVNATEADRPAGYLTYNGGGVKSWTLLFGSGSASVGFRQDPGGTQGTITDLSGQTLWGTIVYTSV